MNKQNKNDFKNSIKCWICDNDYIDKDIKVRDHCHISGRYRGSAHRHFNINLQLNNKISIVFRNMKNYNSRLIMQNLGKFNLKLNVIRNGLERHMSFTVIIS